MLASLRGVSLWPAVEAESVSAARRSSIGFDVGRLLRASPGGRAPRNPRDFRLLCVVRLLSDLGRRGIAPVSALASTESR